MKDLLYGLYEFGVRYIFLIGVATAGIFIGKAMRMKKNGKNT